MPKTSMLHEYARMGATARIAELQAEIAQIEQMFPNLDGPAPAHKGPGAAAALPALSRLLDPAPKRRRRKLSAAARKAISDAQKKRWAALKAKK